MMPRFRFGDPWRVLWQIATSDYLLGGVLLALALALLLAAWLPQTSARGPALDVAWQAQVQRRFGGVAWFETVRALLQALGAFHVTGAAWFRLLLALLALALLARLVDSVEGLWQGWRGSAPPTGASWVGQVGAWTFEELVTSLRRRRIRVVDITAGEAGDGAGPPVEVVRADRWPWGELGPILVYLGGLLVLLGAAVVALRGWQTGSLPVAIGEAVRLEHGSDLTLRLQALSDDGRRGAGEIWYQEDRLVGAGDLAVGRPLTGRGVGAYLVGSGTGVQVRATLSDTQVLELATGPDQEARDELTLTFTEDEPRQLVGVLETDLVLLLTMPRPIQTGALPRVQVFESGSGQPILEQDASADAALTVGDVSFMLASTPYAEIRVFYSPGAFWSQLGVIGLVAGLLLWGLWPPQRLWLRRQDGVEAVGDVRLLASRSAQPNGDEV